MAFENLPEHDAIVEKLLIRARNMSPNQVLTWSELEAAIGYRRHSGPTWSTTYIRFRRDAREKLGLVFRPVRNLGLRLLPSSEQVTVVSVDRRRKMLKQGRVARKEISSAADSKLSVPVRQLKYAQINQLKEEERTIRKGQRLKACDGMPMPKPRIKTEKEAGPRAEK